MNLLITNGQELQAYIILRCLRAEARKIIVTEGGDSVGSTGFRNMAAFSRFVDARYQVPHFASDWLAGRLEAANTDAEEVYMLRIEAICRQEKVDVIFPSLDPEVYLFAKNKARLAHQGVLAVVPDPGVIRIPMNKALTVRAAQAVGFPCPKTYFPDSEADIDRILLECEPPYIVKPRFTAHAANMVYAERREDLAAAYRQVSAFQPSPIVQEYIRDGLPSNYYLTIDRNGQILSVLNPLVTRTYRYGFRASPKACISSSTGPHLEELRMLLSNLGLSGSYTIQTLIDPRDGAPKLLEINARMGQHLWWRTDLGVNEPLICLQLARGQTPSGNFRFPDGVLMLNPYHDLFYLYDQFIQAAFDAGRRLLRRRGSDEPQFAVQPGNPGVMATLRLYRRDYLNRRPKVFCPEVRNLWVDPYPCLRAFWFKFSSMTGSAIGRAWRTLRG